MDDATTLTRRPGGTVEPLDRSGLAKNQKASAAERFELRDPFAEVTHRAKTFEQMVSTAERVGAIRFTAIGVDGKPTQVLKVDGQWLRDDPQRNKAPVRDDAQRSPNVVPLTAPAPSEASQSPVDAEAQRIARVAQIDAALNERYLIKRSPLRIGAFGIGQTEYRHRGDTSRLAFTETTFKLSTDSSSPSVARSMVDVAEARNWQALRVSGNEDFRRSVWLEASLRGVRTVGYEPVPGDQELLRKEREARQINRIEPVFPGSGPSEANAKASGRGGTGRKAVLAALEAVLVAKHVPERQRQIVMAAAAENLAQRLRNGETHRIKVYDKAAAPQRTAPTPMREPQRARERGAPTR